MLVRPAFSTTTGFFFDTRFATSANERPSFRSSAVLRDDLRVVVLLEERQQVVLVDVDLLPRPTIADTPIFAEREKPMIAMPMPPDCDDSAAWPFTSYAVQNVAHRFFHV